MTHSEEVLTQLHEQVAEMCRYLEVPEGAMHDAWSLRDAIVALKRRTRLFEVELDFEYGCASVADLDAAKKPDTFKWESF